MVKDTLFTGECRNNPRYNGDGYFSLRFVVRRVDEWHFLHDGSRLFASGFDLHFGAGFSQRFRDVAHRDVLPQHRGKAAAGNLADFLAVCHFEHVADFSNVDLFF